VIQAHPLPSNANRLYISVVYVFKKGKHTPSGSNGTSLPSPSASVVSEDGNENQALGEGDINGNENRRGVRRSRA